MRPTTIGCLVRPVRTRRRLPPPGRPVPTAARGAVLHRNAPPRHYSRVMTRNPLRDADPSAFFSELLEVRVPPPPPRLETPTPRPGYVWIPGHWDWIDASHTWMPGHWEPERSGFRWLAHRWVLRCGRWY